MKFSPKHAPYHTWVQPSISKYSYQVQINSNFNFFFYFQYSWISLLYTYMGSHPIIVLWRTSLDSKAHEYWIVESKFKNLFILFRLIFFPYVFSPFIFTRIAWMLYYEHILEVLVPHVKALWKSSIDANCMYKNMYGLYCIEKVGWTMIFGYPGYVLIASKVGHKSWKRCQGWRGFCAHCPLLDWAYYHRGAKDGMG